MSDKVEGGFSYKGSRPGPWSPEKGERVQLKPTTDWWTKGARSGTVVSDVFTSPIDGKEVEFARVHLDCWSSRRREVTMRVENLMEIRK